MNRENFANAAIIIGGLLLTGWCVGRAQAQVKQDGRVFRGITLPGNSAPFWKGCSEMLPIPQASDGSMSGICTDLKGRKYDLIVRPINISCSAVTPKEPDSYQHFICSAQDERMIRPQSREGDTERRQNLGTPALQ